MHRIPTTATLAVARLSFMALLGGKRSVFSYPIQALSVIPSNDMPSTEMYIVRLVIAGILVLMGGFFAGLTLGLMGLDETNLQVLLESDNESERKNARHVLDLLKKGKYWVLVTLLLSNVIVNETLPIILDSIIGGGWLAVLISTALIVIFGEVIPQSICVRHGLAVGAKCSNIVLVMMYIMYPVAYPTSYMLGFFLGESRGTIYKKAGLKTLVSLHRSNDGDDIDGLTEDEVHIIGSVLDLREKLVVDVMTPIQDVFTLTVSAILDKELVHKILLHGYSRIPIRESEYDHHYIGMLLVKNLISYDAEDRLPVSHFHIRALPETYPDTSCLDILNFFQEGKSHMSIISNNPGENDSALGVITLEDVIESLIGEEIVDETDVFIDVHKKIKVNRRAHKRLQSIIPFVRISTPPIDAVRQTQTSSESTTGIKIRMKGYGAIVDNGTGNNSTVMPQQQQPQLEGNNNHDNINEPKN